LLSVGDRENPREDSVAASGLDICESFRVLEQGRTLAFWMRSAHSRAEEGWSWYGEAYKFARPRHRGRSRWVSFAIDRDAESDRVCSAGQFLAVAVRDFPVTRVSKDTATRSAPQIQVVFRLIGHTAAAGTAP
jgi:hypothetical protein